VSEGTVEAQFYEICMTSLYYFWDVW